jgi:hypothetical protein
MDKITNKGFNRFAGKAKEIIMDVSKKAKQVDLSKLKQLPDELNIGSEAYKFDPDVQAHIKTSIDGARRLIKKFMKK